MNLRHLVLVMFGLLLAACGGGSDDLPDATSTGTAGPSATRTGTPTITVTPMPKPTNTPAPTSPPAPTQAAIQPTSPPPPPPPAGPLYGHATSNISVPAGFRAFVVAEGFYRPTSVAAGGGAVYVSERHGTLYRLLDLDGTGFFEVNRRFASGYDTTTGIMVSSSGTLYVSHTGSVTIVRDTNGDTVGDTSQRIISGLPNGRHQNNGLVFGPDGKLYLTNGSTCDECVEANQLSATVLRANANGSGLRVFARGLRNPYDIVFDGAGRLWATDNGSDSPCATIDELDVIRDGQDYGWPYRPACNPLNDGVRPAADLGLHTASTGIEYYDGGQFPGYAGSLFLTLWNSPTLLRAVPGAGAQPGASASTFASGFAHPIDVVVAPNGTLFVLDYGSGNGNDGKLYRIAWVGG